MDAPLKIHRELLWDYDLKPEDLEREDVRIFYISRVLNQGTVQEVRDIPIALIRHYLKRLNLTPDVRRFWEWYLKGRE